MFFYRNAKKRENSTIFNAKFYTLLCIMRRKSLEKVKKICYTIIGKLSKGVTVCQKCEAIFLIDYPAYCLARPLYVCSLIKINEPFDIGALCLFVEWLFYFEDLTMKKRIQKFELIGFIIISVLTLCVMVAALLIAILPRNYPSTEKLSYEELSYIRYEHKEHRRFDKYLIYVEEYDEPLQIGSVTETALSESALSSLDNGDVITVGYHISKDSKEICSISSGNNDILNFDNYLAAQQKNDRVGIIFGWVFFAIFSFALVVEAIHFVKTGKCVSRRARFRVKR